MICQSAFFCFLECKITKKIRNRDVVDDFYFVGWDSCCALMVMRKTVPCPGMEYLRAMCPLW